MKYTYIKQRHGKTEETKIRFTSDSEERKTHAETEIRSEEGAPPEFIAAMQALTPDFIEILELPEEYAEGLEVHTLSLRHQDDRWGVVISGSKSLAGTKGPFNPSTPILMQPKETDGYGKVGVLSRELEQKIMRVVACADEFRKGARAQQEMQLEGTEAKTGRGKGADLTPIEEEVERQAKTYRSGEVPAEETPEEAHVAAAEEAGQDIGRTPFDDEDEDLPWERCSYPNCVLEGGHPGPHDVEEPSGSAEPEPDVEDDGEKYDPEEGTPLTTVDALNTTLLTVLRKAGIITLEELAARREGVPAIRGIGPTSLKAIDEALEAAGAVTPEEEEDDSEPEDDRPRRPDIGDTVVPEKNTSYTLRVLSFDSQDEDRVLLRGVGVAEGEENARYAMVGDMTWDPENERWTTTKLYTFDAEPMPA